MIDCQICGKQMGVLTSSHLKAHQYSFDLYREKFPGAPLVSEAHKERLRVRNAARSGTKASQETKDKMSASRKGKTHSQETKDKIGAGNKGKVMSREAIEKQKASRKIAEELNGGGFATGPRSQEFKDKMSEIAKARPRERQLANAQAMIKARTGMTLTDQQKDNIRNGTIKWMKDNPKRVFNTKVEIAFREFLESYNVEYVQQFVIDGVQHPYDFYLPEFNTIVEIDGPQHWKHAIWGTSGKSQEEKDQIFLNQIEKDAFENWQAGLHGYRIVRIQITNGLGNFIEQMEQQDLFIQ